MSLGYYLTFNGTVNQYGALSSATYYENTSGTIECRFKTTADTSESVQYLVAKDVALVISINQVVGYSFAGGYGYSGTLVNDGRWHHAAFSFTGVSPNNTGYLYLDGVLKNTFTCIISGSQASALNIGNSFNGSLDEVRIWNTVLSDATILSNYNSITVSPTSTGLTGYWKLNEGSGTTANNSVSGQPAFTLIGSPTWTPVLDYAVNGTNLSTMFYHDTLRLNSNLTRYTGVSIGQRANYIYNNSVTVVPTETKYKISGVDICNNIFFKYVETDISTSIPIPDWCTHISAVLIGGGAGGGGGGGAVNCRLFTFSNEIIRNGGNGGGGGSGSINAINNLPVGQVGQGKTLQITIGGGGTAGSAGTDFYRDNGAGSYNINNTSGGNGGNGFPTIINLIDSQSVQTYSIQANAGSFNTGLLGNLGNKANAGLNQYGSSDGANGPGGAGGVNTNGGFSGNDGSGVSGGVTKFTSYFTNSFSPSNGNGGKGGNGGIASSFTNATPGDPGTKGYARIYFLSFPYSYSGDSILDDVIINSIKYKCITLKSSGDLNFNPNINVNVIVEYFLIVGGGGNTSSTTTLGGGGGGGGCVGINKATIPLSANQTYTVQIGDKRINDGVTSITYNGNTIGSANPGEDCNSSVNNGNGAVSGATTDTDTIDYSPSFSGGTAYIFTNRNGSQINGGGGGGANGIGDNGIINVHGKGGLGVTFIDGNIYGDGGNGGGYSGTNAGGGLINNSNDGTPNTGGGADGSYTNISRKGGSGIIKMYYR